MTFVPANLYFNDGNSKHIDDTLLYVNGNFNSPLPGTGYWITNNAYANNMTSYWGGWWVAYFYDNNKCRIGFGRFSNIPTEQQIINTVQNANLVNYTLFDIN
jgi:CubicO group peptidase (beta-lactamase class C family)